MSIPHTDSPYGESVSEMEVAASNVLLCARCKQLDDGLLKAEQGDIPATGLHLISIGRVLEKTKCETCRFFLNLAPVYQRKHKLHVRVFNRISQPRGEASSALPRLFLSVLRQNERLRYDHSIEDEIVQQGLVIFTPKTNQTSLDVSLVNPDLVDYSLLSSSMMHCKESHDVCRPSFENGDTLSYINLIDCSTCRIVRGDFSMAYLALSYVWGRVTTRQKDDIATKKTHAGRQFTLQSMPLTVRDAIQVTRYLDMRYLWVDRYCID
jgi:hypothetical protein